MVGSFAVKSSTIKEIHDTLVIGGLMVCSRHRTANLPGALFGGLRNEQHSQLECESTE
jgi:hypothetical protein